MRDLANQDYSKVNLSSNSFGSKSKIIIQRSTLKIFGTVVVVLAILIVIKILTTSGSLVGSSSIVLKDAPKGLTPVVENVSGNLADDALKLSIENASFTNVSNQAGSANATRKYGDGSFTMTVNASLPETKGDTYQVWIVGDSILKLVGTLTGPPGNMFLVFNDIDNYSSTNQIWITRELTSDEGIPELHILEGSF